MPTKKIQRKQKAKRFRGARSDASISSIQSTLEEKFKLPSGSIKLVYPSGRKARSDATVGSLIARWEK